MRMRIPQITSIETALRLHDETIELNNAQIQELFGPLGSNRISALKKMVRDELTAQNKPIRNERTVDTDTAYKVWGLDIDQIEKKHAKMRKHGFVKEASV